MEGEEEEEEGKGSHVDKLGSVGAAGGILGFVVLAAADVANALELLVHLGLAELDGVAHALRTEGCGAMGGQMRGGIGDSDLEGGQGGGEKRKGTLREHMRGGGQWIFGRMHAENCPVECCCCAEGLGRQEGFLLQRGGAALGRRVGSGTRQQGQGGEAIARICSSGLCRCPGPGASSC